MKKLNDDHFCFACGSKNPRGLKLVFDYDEHTDEVITHTKFIKEFQGWEDVIHGGIVSTTLDESMAKAVDQKGYKCVTAEMTVKFKQPALIGTPYVVRGKIKEIRNKLITTVGSIKDKEENTIATASAKFFIISEKKL